MKTTVTILTPISPFLLQIPFYSVLGNHDYGRDSPTAKHSIQPQIEYTFFDSQWYLPSRYYTVRPRASIPVHITAYDSSVFLDKYLKSTSTYNSPELVYGSRATVRQGQVQWLQNSLKKAKAAKGWSFLVGHHPLVSAADGAYTPLNATITAAIGAADVAPHLTFNGHDHILAHWTHDQVGGERGEGGI